MIKGFWTGEWRSNVSNIANHAAGKNMELILGMKESALVKMNGAFTKRMNLGEEPDKPFSDELR